MNCKSKAVLLAAQTLWLIGSIFFCQPLFAEKALNRYNVTDLGDNTLEATGFNNRGQVVGVFVVGNQNSYFKRAFLYTDGRLVDGSLGGGISEANGINDRDQIVGFSYIERNPQRS